LPCGARPPHPINIKGMVDWGIKSIKSIYFYIFIFSLCLKLFYYLLLLLHLYVDWGRSTWPCRLYSNPTCTAPTRSCSGDVQRSFAGSPRQRFDLHQSDRWAKVWPVTHTSLTGAYAGVLQWVPLRACWPDTGATLVEQQWFLLGVDSLMSLIPVHVVTKMIAFSIHDLSFVLWSLSMQPPLNWWW
jgi:hypothetical protein